MAKVLNHTACLGPNKVVLPTIARCAMIIADFLSSRVHVNLQVHEP